MRSPGRPWLSLKGSSEREQLLQLVLRGLAAVLTHFERLRIVNGAGAILSIEFDESVAIVVRLRGVAAAETAADFVVAALASGGIRRIDAGMTVGAALVDLRNHEQQAV